MNATPLIGPSAPHRATPQIQCRIRAWMTKPPAQPMMRNTFLVSTEFMTVPAVAMIIGIMTRNTSGTFSVKWYGGGGLYPREKRRSTPVTQIDGVFKEGLLPLFRGP